MCTDLKEVKGRLRACGKCPQCLERKRWIYSARIAAECFVHPRTWFVTLTLRKNMSDKTGYKLVQRWLKRVRKGLSSPIRYACVAEHGSKATMRLHYHVVVHGELSLTQRSLRSKWRGGISQAKLVHFGDAGNVGQYSSKMARYTAKGHRFRFSQGYGSRALTKVWENEILQACLAYWPDARVRLSGITMPFKLRPVVPFKSIFTQDEHDCWRFNHGPKNHLKNLPR